MKREYDVDWGNGFLGGYDEKYEQTFNTPSGNVKIIMPNVNIKLGDLINVQEFCESLGYPYYAALYIGVGEDVKPSSSIKDLDGYPLILKWFCNHRYEVIKVDKKYKTNI